MQQTSTERAAQTLLNLNQAALEATAESPFLDRLLDEKPVVLAMFNGAGGRFVLHRPGHRRREAPSVPVQYQLLKAIGHVPVAVHGITKAGLKQVAWPWQEAFRAWEWRLEAALGSLGTLMDSDRDDAEKILLASLRYIRDSLAANRLDDAAGEVFARSIVRPLNAGIHSAARLQVAHWMSQLASWRKELGNDWSSTYGVASTLYVTRRNNILFCLLAQFMGESAIGDRLFLLETTEFDPKPQTLLSVLAKIVAQRELGKTFFDQYYLMGNEILAGAARQAITNEATARGMPVVLPDLAPALTHEWPWPTKPQEDGGVRVLDDAVERL